MRALAYTQPLEVQLLDRPEPELVTGEVVLHIDAVGICGSDMHAFHGHDPRRKPGLVLGHEFCGTVVKGAAPAYQKGVRVTGNPLITCGSCDYCVRGRNNLCSHRTRVGMMRPGAFAEPAATALHAINMSVKALARPLPENCTLIIGGGAIGMLAALLLKTYGCRGMVLAEVNPLRRQSAEKHAGVTTHDPRETQPQENGFDYVIDAVGSKLSSAIVFALLLVLAQHDRWTPRTAMLYGASGAVVLGGPTRCSSWCFRCLCHERATLQTSSPARDLGKTPGLTALNTKYFLNQARRSHAHPDL